ncbi:MAG: flap endonuclease-1 [Candidatus Micrarchaeia archaeon]|jgi:flap endonuclease-1
MGVDLGDVPKRAVALSDLSGKRFAVDAYNAIYQFLSSIRQPDGTPLKDSDGNITAHLTGIFYRNARLLEHGIRPIYVFDGNPPEFKSDVISERAGRKAEAEANWKDALERGDMASAKKYAQASSRLTHAMVEESKELLRSMGIPVVEAPSEGEAQASQLVIEGAADAAASQDMDCLLFGAPLLLRNLSVGGRRKMPGRNDYVEIEPEFIELQSALSALGVSRQQLVWMGILIGTDFDEGVKGVGPKKALKIVRECKTLREAAEKAGAADEMALFESVEHFFLEPPVEKGVKIAAEKMDREKIVKFLCGKHDFSEERVSRTIAAAEKSMKETGAQTRLGSWQ